jgi:hypothetical protein
MSGVQAPAGPASVDRRQLLRDLQDAAEAGADVQVAPGHLAAGTASQAAEALTGQIGSASSGSISREPLSSSLGSSSFGSSSFGSTASVDSASAGSTAAAP